MLRKGKSKKVISENIKMEMEHDKQLKQTIAMNKAGMSKKDKINRRKKMVNTAAEHMGF